MEAKGQKRLLIVLIILISLSVLTVSATNIVEEVATPLFGSVDISKFYNENAKFIDFILLSIIFIGLSYFGLSKRFVGEGETASSAVKAVMVAVGIALAFGAVTLLGKAGKTLGDFGPIAMGILFLVIGFAFYEIAVSFGIPRFFAGALAYLLAYASFSATNGLNGLESLELGFIVGILNLIKAGCIIISIYGLFVIFMSVFRSIGAYGAPAGGAAAPIHTLADAERRERRELADDRRAAQLENEAEKLNREEARLNNVELSDESAELNDLENLASILRELSHTARLIEEERRRRPL